MKISINKCNRPYCGLSKSLIVGNRFTFKSGKIFHVTTSTGCDAKDLCNARDVTKNT